MYQLNFLYEHPFLIDVAMTIDDDIFLKYEVHGNLGKYLKHASNGDVFVE